MEKIYWIEKVVAGWRGREIRIVVGRARLVWWCDERIGGEMLKWATPASDMQGQALRMLKRERF
ncbi:MAG: hypothetical protein ACYS1A_00005 [Planctomycetota bacterium]